MLLSVHMPLYRAQEFDYPFDFAVASVFPVADEAHLVIHDTGDGTWERAEALAAAAPIPVILHQLEWWSNERGCECLADATNYGIEQCRGFYHLALQADEVLHEDDLPALQQIMADRHVWAEFGRLNLHGDFDTYNANVNRWPCSVVRLARREFYPTLRSYGDATHLGWMENYDERKYPRYDAREEIRLFHYAYTRPGRAFVDRQANMAALYNLNPDPAIEICRETQTVDWARMVPREEFKPLPRRHPAVMERWIAARRHKVAAGAWE